MGFWRVSLLLLGTLRPGQVEASLKCPGKINMDGYGPVSLVNAKWNTPTERARKVDVIKVNYTEIILPHMKGRTYFANTCVEERYDNTHYLALNLLGKTMRYTTDLSAIGCGCNAALYLTSMNQNPNPSECFDHYCDANHGCGDSCAEIDIQGANQHAWRSSVSTPSNPSGASGGYGGGVDFTGPRDWGHVEYSPHSKCINTSAPFEVAVSFPIDAHGALVGMFVTLSQGDGSCLLKSHIENYHGFAELTTALSAGMTPIISYWSSDDMLWMDGPGTDSQGPCRKDDASACAETAKFYNFSVERIATSTTTPPPTLPPVPTLPPALIDSPVSHGTHIPTQHGVLKVQGNQIIGETGQPVRLRGMSFFWSQWMGKFWNADVVQWLKKDWNVTLLRCAMGVEKGGYLEHPSREKAKLETVVTAAIEAGIYVIIDWHDYNAHLHVNEAKTFFGEMAHKYGAYPNVLFEIFNEPQQIGWADTIKPYHEQIIPVIRKHTKNIIILGTRMWSQDVDEASQNPVVGDNLVYTIHFYAASMKQELRNKVSTALANGVAVFASEWGTCEYTGNGALDLGEVQAWLSFFEQHHISDANWAISDKAESCSALVDGASRHGGWAEFQLTPSGVFVRASLRASTLVVPMPSLPTQAPAATTTKAPPTVKAPASKHSKSSSMTLIHIVAALGIGASLVMAIVFLAKLRKQLTPLKACRLQSSRTPSAQNLLLTVNAEAGKAN